MARVEDLDQMWSKRKAIVTLLPYVVLWERSGDHRMVDTLIRIIRAPKMAPFVSRPMTTLFDKASPNSRNRVVTLLSPYACWGTWGFSKNTVTWWAAAALATPYTEEVGQSVVDTLLQIASNNSLTLHVPVNIWAFLKKRPPLPPICEGRSVGTLARVVRSVRELGDVELPESYLLLVWSEWNVIYSGGFIDMYTSIREDFGGIGMWRHREVLIERLDHILAQLGRGLGFLKQQKPILGQGHIPEARERYGKLKGELMEVGREALEVLTRMPFRLINSFDLLTPVDVRRVTLDVRLCASSPVSVSRAHNACSSFPHLYILFSCWFSLSSLRAPSITAHTSEPTIAQLFKTRASSDISRCGKYTTLTSSVEGGSAGGRVARVVISTLYHCEHNLSLYMRLLLHVPVSLSHPASHPHDSRQISTLPLTCEVPPLSVVKSGSGNSIGPSPGVVLWTG